MNQIEDTSLIKDIKNAEEISGTVFGEVERNGSQVKMKMRVTEVNKRKNTKPFYIQVQGIYEKDILFGDRVIIAPRKNIEQKNQNFDYGKYLKGQGVAIYFQKVKIKRVDYGYEKSVHRELYKIRERISKKIDHIFFEPESSLLGGLIIGERRSFPESLYDALQVTGTLHVVAISGYNIALVVFVVDGVFKKIISLHLRIPIIVLAILVFIVVTGATASVVRAGIMGMLTVALTKNGKTVTQLNGMLISAVIMSAHNPLVITHDVGFQLSFAATAGIVYLSPWIIEKITFIPNIFGSREAVGVSIASQIATLPISIFHFSTVSLVSVLANTVIAPLISFATLSGIIAILLASIIPSIQYITTVPVYFVLKAIIKSIEYCAKIPYAYFELQGHFKMTLVFVVGLVVILIMRYRK